MSKEKPKIILTGTKGVDMHVVLTTGTEVVIREAGVLPVVDTHMHIQSNNCCPLTLQWALKAGVIGWLLGRPMETRKSLNDMTAGWVPVFSGRLGKLGRLSTDLIAKIFIGDVRNSEMKETLYWTVISESELNRIRDEKKKQTLAEERAGLEELQEATINQYEEFYKNCAYYFNNKKLFHIFVALPMDLSFAHYWGKYGLPIYLHDEQHMYFINDFTRLTIVSDSQSRTADLGIEKDINTPATGKSSYVANDYGSTARTITEEKIHLYADYDLKRQYQYYREYQEAAARGEKPENKFYFHFAGEEAVLQTETQKKFCHFMDIAPAEDDMKFEDYKKQFIYTLASAIRYPLQLFPFYHYDPRRHYTGPKEETLKMRAQLIEKEHAFYQLTPGSGTPVSFQDGEHYRGIPEAEPLLAKWGTDYVFNLLSNKSIANEKVYEFLLTHPQCTRGLAWGIKMYPNLGYAPDDFVTFPHLSDFYTQCQSARIPITFHCSPGGMSIADPCNYERFSGTIKAAYPFKESWKYITDNLSAPANWRRVLERYGGLKLCMAHFGGDDLWKDKDSPYYSWIDDIGSLADTYENVYTDLAYYTNPDPFLFWRRRERLARDLAAVIKAHPALKHRLLMGSDWYMIELDRFKGVGTYYRKMFELLKLVSKEVNWDAWHQFAVINPLRFLGFIDETKGDNGPYKIKQDNLIKYKENVKKWLGDRAWLQRAEIKETEVSKIEVRITESAVIKHLEDPHWEIMDSSTIKKDGQLLILSE